MTPDLNKEYMAYENINQFLLWMGIIAALVLFSMDIAYSLLFFEGHNLLGVIFSIVVSVSIFCFCRDVILCFVLWIVISVVLVLLFMVIGRGPVSGGFYDESYFLLIKFVFSLGVSMFAVYFSRIIPEWLQIWEQSLLSRRWAEEEK